MKLLLMGPQGCGKGTQGEMLSDALGIPLVSVGQTLRELPVSSPHYELIRNLINKGSLAPQDLVAQILKEKVSKSGYENGYIMDGWGRADEDLKLFDPNFDKVIYISIAPETTIKRLSSRRTCSKCGDIYNITTMPPRKEGICDKCGGKLIQRIDDTEEAIEKRLDTFHLHTIPVINRIREQGKLIEIGGEGTPEEVHQLIMSALKL